MFVLIFQIFESVGFAQEKQSQTLQIPPTRKIWTGDLDGMIKRRVIRILTVYNKTFYFLDKDTQKGIVYDAMKVFEDELNKKYKTGNLRVHVVFFPVSRDELLTGLAEGRGDIACANLTITEDRKKLVDFTDPTLKNASEIVVTGPASPPITKLDDLAGQEVFVRKSSSYYDSLTKVNSEFKKQGKKEIILKFAPEELENEDFLEMLKRRINKDSSSR